MFMVIKPIFLLFVCSEDKAQPIQGQQRANGTQNDSGDILRANRQPSASPELCLSPIQAVPWVEVDASVLFILVLHC